jgi:hypothetical protein
VRLIDPVVSTGSGRAATRIEDDFEEPVAEDRIAPNRETTAMTSASFADEFHDPIADSTTPTLESAEPMKIPAGTAVAPVTAARPMSFGRGRRREAIPPPAPSETATPVPAVESSVDPFEPETAEEAQKPVVDVAADTGTPETDREREARIDEMERALENFGRRRSPDYGRRGRRR